MSVSVSNALTYISASLLCFTSYSREVNPNKTTFFLLFFLVSKSLNYRFLLSTKRQVSNHIFWKFVFRRPTKKGAKRRGVSTLKPFFRQFPLKSDSPKQELPSLSFLFSSLSSNLNENLTESTQTRFFTILQDKAVHVFTRECEH